jgi:hypothetical protein
MSAIFGERLLYPQEAGPDVQLMVTGDEFYARRETISGYTVVYDQDLGLYCYAQLAQGWFVTTRVPITKPPPPGIPRTSTNGRWSAGSGSPSGAAPCSRRPPPTTRTWSSPSGPPTACWPAARSAAAGYAGSPYWCSSRTRPPR